MSFSCTAGQSLKVQVLYNEPFLMMLVDPVVFFLKTAFQIGEGTRKASKVDCIALNQILSSLDLSLQKSGLNKAK